jgi:mannose-6-phosphate isomerase
MRRVDKPWGHEIIWSDTELYVGKILVVRAGQRLSLQYHLEKDESFLIDSGEVELLLDDDEGELRAQILREGDAVRILPGRRHRLRAITDCRVIEVSTPHLDDVVRVSDDFGRVP